MIGAQHTNFKELDKLRKRIDVIDQRILQALKDRFDVARSIAAVKSSHHLPLIDRKREEAIVAGLLAKAPNSLLEDAIEALYEKIFSLSAAQQILSRPKVQPFQGIGFIGTGLIGGSIIKTIRASQQKVVIHVLDDHRRDVQLAIRGGWVDNKHRTLASLTRAVDLLILAVPIDRTIPLARRIARMYQGNLPISSLNQGGDLKGGSHNLLIIDVASVKEKIAQSFALLTTDHIEFVPTHPMGGSEKSGFAASRANLIVNLPWIVTPHARNTLVTRRKLKQWIGSLGGRYYEMDAREHDRILAMISHLVFLISTYLYAFAYDQVPEALRFAGSGFEGVTRLTSGSPEMHATIYRENERAVKKAMRSFLRYVERHPMTTRNALHFFQKYKQARDRQYMN